MSPTRRQFLVTAGTAAAAAAVGAAETQPTSRGPQAVLISSANGLPHLAAARSSLVGGGDTLDAALMVLKALEDDPDDQSVGYGGLPNEEGEVELDACVMHGPTRRAGAVAGVRRIRNVSLLAKTVMERTDHLLLVGDGARSFAVAHGFPEENLLTERARKTWLLWKEGMSLRDSWGPGLADPAWIPPERERSAVEAAEGWTALAARLGIDPSRRGLAVRQVLSPPTGTVHCSVLSAEGDLSGATSTSGLAWKIPGRVGDSPIIGAGCFTDPDIGSAGATGRGEECIRICGAHTIVENLRRGMSPLDAGLDALGRISRNFGNDMGRLRHVSMTFYVLRKDGAFAGVSMWSHLAEGKRRQFAVHDGTARLVDTVALFEGEG